MFFILKKTTTPPPQQDEFLFGGVLFRTTRFEKLEEG
jgi:hypothetical protein